VTGDPSTGVAEPHERQRFEAPTLPRLEPVPLPRVRARDQNDLTALFPDPAGHRVGHRHEGVAVALEAVAAPEDLEFATGGIRAKADPGRGLTLREVVVRAYNQGEGPPIGRGTFRGLNPAHDPATVEGHPEPARAANQYATQIAQVRVDPDTGEVEVLRLVCVQDVGFAFNPLQLEGQIEGGVVQGQGYAVSEEMILEGGAVAAPGLEHMLMPTAMDVGEVESHIVEVGAEDGPYGAKGAGETPVVATAAAIANAVADATGAFVRELPVTPERVLRAMKGNRKNGR